MRVFVINLDRCPERMTRLAGLLGALGVPFERIAAVDGRELDPIPSAKAFNGRYVMTRSELACVLSHRMAWFRFMASADEYCLVLEDDVHLGKDFGAIARGDIGLEAAAFDLIKIETRSHKIWVDRFDARTVGGQRRIARLHSAHLGAAAYIISRAGAEKVLPATESGARAVDEILFGGHGIVPAGLRSYQMIPALAIQDELLRETPSFAGLSSMITPDRLARPKQIGMGKLLREAGRPFRQLAEIVMPLHLMGEWRRVERRPVGFE
ncbi:MAG: glycosyltransferase family 25 protein [Roseiarcus sp.]|jgi:glycosyl transferase family 25